MTCRVQCAQQPELTNAWLAEHVMGWHEAQRPLPGSIMTHAAWLDDDDTFQAWVATWDPLHRIADAMQLLDSISMHMKSRYLLWSIDNSRTRVTCKIANEHPADSALWCWGDAPTLCEAICRAAQAWVLTKDKTA